MRKVNGADVTINELKNTFFGYDGLKDPEFYDIVDRFTVGEQCYTITEEGDFIRFPTDFLNNEIFPDICIIDTPEEITVYNFIMNYWNLNDFSLDEFDFYFVD